MVETCQSDQPYCFQLISPDGEFESRECWSLKYEVKCFKSGDLCGRNSNNLLVIFQDQEYSGVGCYRGTYIYIKGV